ncbi:hypothetical protein ACIBHX_48945 [Nonomuraea sp. NPDC050536]|uniref:hypothetical protein n=1 Tax=Nonomuraea sp. NPDC050536 TaxID=3364366 RepID=UPI0037C9E2DE
MLTRTKAATIACCTAFGMIGLLGTVAPAAYATSSGSNCVGTLVEEHDLKAPSGKVLGYLNLYWDGSTGENCLTVTSSSIDWGIPKRMYADLYECATDIPTKCAPVIVQRIDNQPNYRYQAGPISVPAAGHCILFVGGVNFGGEVAYYNGAEVGSHC